MVFLKQPPDLVFNIDASLEDIYCGKSKSIKVERYRKKVKKPEIETKKVKVKIYNAAGYLVEDDLINDKLTHYEFNEIPWDASQVDAGLYLAEIKPNVGQSELVRLVVIK